MTQSNQDPDSQQDPAEPDELAEDTQEQKALAVPEEKPAKSGGGGRGLALLALLVGFLAALGTGFMWWQYRQFYVDLDAADATTAESVERVQGQVAALADKLDSLERAEQTVDRRLDALTAELETVPLRMGELQSRLDAIRGVSGDARRRWLRAEAEYLLALANQELALAGRWRAAIQALTLADSKLRELANPELTPVRDEIAAALQRLRAVDLPDTEGISLTLANLADMAQTLPLQGPAERVGSTAADPVDEAAPGAERAWASVKSAFSDLIRIDRRDEPVLRAFSAREAALLRTSLKLELQAARFALLEGESETYKDSLRAAQTALSSSFDEADAGVASAKELLRSLLEVAPAPERPNISEPLNLLRQINARNALEDGQ